VQWSDPPAATGAGGGQLTTIDIPATAARFLRVVQTAAAPQWWSVADLRVYR
jgi:glucosylceramidase